MKDLFRKMKFFLFLVVSQVLLMAPVTAQAGPPPGTDSGIFLMFEGDNMITPNDCSQGFPVFKHNVFNAQGAWLGTFKECVTNQGHEHVLDLPGIGGVTFLLDDATEASTFGLYGNFLQSYPDLAGLVGGNSCEDHFTEGCYVLMNASKHLVPDVNMTLANPPTGVLKKMKMIKVHAAFLGQMVRVGQDLMPNEIKALDSTLFFVTKFSD